MYTTPTTRFASVIRIFDFYKQIKKIYLKKNKSLMPHKKVLYRTLNYSVTSLFRLNYAGVVYSYIYNKKPYNSFLNVKSIFNNSIVVPGIELLVPGKKIWDLTSSILFKKVKFIGSQIFLKDLPYYAYICYLVNKNMKVTYAKSSGAAAVKLKGKKTLKLIVVKLPSTQIYYFAKTTKCFIGKRVNFFVNKFIEGKWGYGVHRFKKINVRGVAMNPVDHPNGGRTKAKQPEKSPWGWIAKQKK